MRLKLEAIKVIDNIFYEFWKFESERVVKVGERVRI